MEEKRFKSLYDFLNNNNELKNFLPKPSGNWEEDKKRFIKMQLEIEEMANLKDVDLK